MNLLEPCPLCNSNDTLYSTTILQYIFEFATDNKVSRLEQENEKLKEKIKDLESTKRFCTRIQKEQLKTLNRHLDNVQKLKEQISKMQLEMDMDIWICEEMYDSEMEENNE